MYSPLGGNIYTYEFTIETIHQSSINQLYHMLPFVMVAMVTVVHGNYFNNFRNGMSSLSKFGVICYYIYQYMTECKIFKKLG